MIIVHTLGAALIDVGTHQIRPTSPRKFAFLLYLAAERGRRTPRAVLQELIFPDQADRNARHSLREMVYQLRHLGVQLETDANGIGIDTTQARADYESIIHGVITPDAISAARGGFLPGFSPAHSEAYTEWYEGYRAQSISSLSRAMIREIDKGMSCGEWDAAERAARACLAIDPLNEAATLALAEMLVLLGAKTKAISLLDEYMELAGRINADLRIPARTLRRRIDQVPDAGGSRYQPRFVGRSEEMRELRRLVHRSFRGETHFGVVSGEPGIGKSRLLSELRSIVALEGWAFAGIAMHPQDVNRPMGAFVDLVPVLLHLPGALGCSPESMESIQRLVSNAPHPLDKREQQPELEIITSRIATAIGDLCEAISSEKPLLLVIEDGHCLDQFSFATISALLSSRQKTRFLMVVSTREPRQLLRTVRHAELVHHLQLGPLSPESTAALIADVLGPEAHPETQILHRLVEAANGNPLFAVSLASHYHETGDSFGTPATLVESIGRRVDPLSPAAISVLGTCIAFGKHCTTDRMIRALKLEPLWLLETLAELSDIGLLDSRADGIAPFHPLVAEVTTRRLPSAVQSVINHQVAEVFERDAIARGSPALWWEAAIRWREAGNAEGALAAIRQCASHAMEIGRASDAARMLSEGLELPISQHSRLAAARELVIAADLSLEPDLVLRGHQILKHGGSASEHDEVELAERRAMSRKTQFPEHLFESTRNCLRSNASAEHRLSAAIIALKCADIAGRGLAMAQMIETEILTATFDDVSRAALLDFELLVNSVKGEWNSAAVAAHRLLVEIDHYPAGARGVHQLNAGLVFFLAGQVELGLETWKRAFESACECNSASVRLRSSLFLATVNLDLYNDAESAFWLDQAIAAMPETPSHANHFDLFVVQLESALSRDDLMEAERLVETARSQDVFANGIVRARWGRALSLMVRARRAQVTTADEELARQIPDDPLPSISGFRDLEIAAAAEVLAIRFSDDARNLMKAFVLNERSTRRPVARELVRVCRRLFRANELDERGLPTVEPVRTATA